jgi:hypothetical protein
MGKGKAVLLHLLAVAAGWGIVAALRPVVGSWQSGGGEVAAESRAPSKTGRVRSTAEIAAGEKLLQSFTAASKADPPGGSDAVQGHGLSLRDLVFRVARESGFDPAAPAPSKDGIGESEEERHAFASYHMMLRGLLRYCLEGEVGPDLAHAYRVGRLEAGALYDSLAAHLPGAAADQTLRRALYFQLAPLDPVRAADLLAPLSEDEAAEMKCNLVVGGKRAVTPDTAFALLSSIPATGNAAGIERRESAWSLATREFLRRYGSDYLPWVEELPAGPDREEAAAALLGRLEEDDLPGYRRIRALVTDPRKLAFFPPR